MTRTDYLVEGLLVFIAAAMVGYMTWGLAHQPAPPTLTPKIDCRTQPGLPWDVVVCPGGHAYHIEDGRWVDLGLVTPIEPVPR